MAQNSEQERLGNPVTDSADEKSYEPFEDVYQSDSDAGMDRGNSPSSPERRNYHNADHGAGQHRNTTRNRSGKRKKKHRRHRSAKVYGILIMLTLIFVISISLAIGIIEIGKDMLGIDGTETLVVFTIEEGMTTAEIAESLHERGIVRIPKAFVYFSRLSNADSSFIPGDHEVSSAMAYETIISELTGTAITEEMTVVDVMFPEGISLCEAAKKLEENKVCDAQKFLYYFNTAGLGYEFENYLPETTNRLRFCKMEGYLFPDTYTFYEDMEPDDVCRRIYVNFNTKMLPEYYTRMEEMNVTLDEVITLASIVQAEAGSVEDMPTIASVFWNRLHSPMTYPRLESDPTTYYVDNVIKPNIDIPDEAVYEAYDTYRCSGLPAGAIGNPGIDAIKAVLYPEDTDYFYFYANIDTGVTYYAKTLADHEANIEMVRQQQEEAYEEEYEEDDEW